MRAIWSFWSKPFEERRGWAWFDPVHHLLAWGLSVGLASRYFPETALITDSRGKALLVDQLGLRFTRVSTELDRLADADPAIWALGKLAAYAAQPAPFVHLDADVFLWRALPPRLLDAPVFAQNPERFPVGDATSGPAALEAGFERHRLMLPAEWQWSRSRWGKQVHQPNCGLVGGNQVEFIRYYARLALELVLEPRYAGVWSSIVDAEALNTTIEQFLLSACVEFHRSHPTSPYKGVHLRYLFPSWEAAFSQTRAGHVGFTHLLAEAKRDEHVAKRLEERVRREDTRFYRRCVELCEAA